MQTEQIDEIREMFRNNDGSCQLSRSDVLRIVEKLAEEQAAQPRVQAMFSQGQATIATSELTDKLLALLDRKKAD